MTEGETKGPSKGELKKAAKKAEKAAKKQQAKAAAENPAGDNKKGAAGGGAGGDKKKGEKAEVKKAFSFQLANVEGHEEAALKAVVTAQLYNIPLEKSVGGAASNMGFAHGPILLQDSKLVAFGPNAVCKALSLYAGQLSAGYLSTVDQWLEYERVELRKAISKNNAKAVTSALKTLNQGLMNNHAGGGYFLVSDALSIADISILVTLSNLNAKDVALPSSVQSYLDHHIQSKLFTTAKDSKILEPPPPPPEPFNFTSDPSMNRAVHYVFLTAIIKTFPQIPLSSLALDKLVQPCKNAKDGDYQCIAAMQLFKPLKKMGFAGANSPQQVAQLLINTLLASSAEENPVCKDFKVNGPGFIVCKISPDYLTSHVNYLLTPSADDTNVYGPKPPNNTKSEQVVVDFSSPNIAKEMHVGHLRSTIIGESVCRILEYCGNKVERVNHVGDWGTQFGMLIQFMKEEGLADDTEKASSNITDLTVFYKKAKVNL